MALKSTLQSLAVAVAAIAVTMAALLNPTTRVALLVVNVVLIAVLVAACLAAGSRQPARSFWMGFAIACPWTLTIDELGRSEVIEPGVFTRLLVRTMEGALPPVPPIRGKPGTKLYYRSGGRSPFYYYLIGGDGTPIVHGEMTLEQLRSDGVAGPLHRLPHLDSIPRSRHRTTICRYAVGTIVGLAGGLLSRAVRRRGDRTALG